jgi:SPP1 family predicted phage head-tail adaptor
MRAGQLDRRITIEQNTPTQGPTGEEAASWSTLATVWAEVRQRRGREFFDSHQVVAEIDTVFLIRHRTDVTAKMRVSWDGRLYDIHYVGEIGRKDGLELMTSAQGS